MLEASPATMWSEGIPGACWIFTPSKERAFPLLYQSPPLLSTPAAPNPEAPNPPKERI